MKTLFFLFIFAGFCTAADGPPIPLPSGEAPGRFVIFAGKDCTMRLDSATGQAWIYLPANNGRPPAWWPIIEPVTYGEYIERDAAKAKAGK